jgi:hypothetical protein
MNDARNRYLLIALALGACCLLLYIGGIFYQSFINNPTDLASLIFIVAMYAGALYYHLRRTGDQR